MGILGSAFNPPHIGHLAFAQEAAWQLGLDRVDFVPTGSPPHKELEGDPGAGVRVEMLTAAIEEEPMFSVSDVELRREGPSYMSDTLAILSEAADEPVEHFLLLGADAAVRLVEWHRPEEIVDRARLAIARRETITEQDVLGALAPICPPECVQFIGLPALGVSSSMIRNRVSNGMPIRYLVPYAVEEMIDERRLYCSVR